MCHLLKSASIDVSGIFENIKSVLMSFELRDVFDIALLAILLFAAFKFIRGRKATALLVGIALCVVIMFFAKFFELNALYTLFSTLIGSGTVVIIILFQPEIRDALEKLGSGSIKGLMNFSDRRKKKELYYNVIENVADAVGELSKECTGALIVMERTTHLTDIIASGVTINADVNSSLIRNLFYNKAPLHDGAIVISEGRIAAAACFLPLTRRNDIDSSVGTRHRAALGMSESSDAVIIVVSEETGTISVAHDCTLIRNLTPSELKDFLHENILRSSCNPTEEK